jgi:hypothetical protein
MPDTDPNLTIDVTGTTGSIATEWVTSGGITNAHVQIVKLAWGDPNTATRVRTSSPLPVTVISNTSTLGISGTVFGAGTFKIVNGISGATTGAITVQGTTASGTTPVQISGYVQGITSGIKVGITGDVTVTNTVTVQGLSGGTEIGITGGRRLNYLTDSVTINGTVGVSGGRYLLPATDGVKVYSGVDGGSTLSFKIHDSSGNSINSSAGALNVNVVGAGITATVSVAAIVGISQADQNVPLFVAGATAGPAVRIKGGLTGGIVEVGWSSALPVSIDPSTALNLTFEDQNIVTELNDIQDAYLANMKTSLETIQSNIDIIKGRLPDTKTYTTNTTLVVPTTVYTGTINLDSNGTSTQIFSGTSTTLKNGITVKSLAPITGSNTSLIKVTGNSNGLTGSAAPYYLSPGESVFLSISNTDKLTFASNGVATSFTFIAS